MRTEILIHDLRVSVFQHRLGYSPSKSVKANNWILIVLAKNNGLVIEYLLLSSLLMLMLLMLLLSQSLEDAFPRLLSLSETCAAHCSLRKKTHKTIEDQLKPDMMQIKVSSWSYITVRGLYMGCCRFDTLNPAWVRLRFCWSWRFTVSTFASLSLKKMSSRSKLRSRALHVRQTNLCRCAANTCIYKSRRRTERAERQRTAADLCGGHKEKGSQAAAEAATAAASLRAAASLWVLLTAMASPTKGVYFG